uniref:TSA: Wollemia nobilis Ref_Wollemi_Transcript_5725_1762 transcribed RNA sequence n=1 Tax=Wollemia nobilis TaxID=56998 RepID=A0A0C9RXJ8_9CONI
MEKNSEVCRAPEQDFLIQWGARKRMRYFKVQVKSGMDVKIKRTALRVDRRVVRAESEAPQPPQTPPAKPTFNRALNSQPAAVKSMAAESAKIHNNGGHSSPENIDRVHTRRRNTNNNGCSSTEDANKVSTDPEEKHSDLEAFVWPKIVIALSNKEKEEDFMAMKGSKLPQRPKKRAKFIQKNLLLVSPGSWLCDLCQERYEVREKKTSRKRRRGLKAMKNVESDSD